MSQKGTGSAEIQQPFKQPVNTENKRAAEVTVSRGITSASVPDRGMSTDLEEQEDELLALQSIFSSEEFGRNESKVGGEIRVCVELPSSFTVAMKEGETLSQYEVSFLPPLLLNFDLPQDYPCSAPPSFTLTCSWLTNAQLSLLGAQLIDLHQATGGTVVLFTWVQFLKEDALRFLDIHDVLELPSDEHRSQNHNGPSPDSGAAHNLSCNLSAHREGDVSAPHDPSASAPSHLPSHASEPLGESGSPSNSLSKSSQGEDQTMSTPFLTPSQRLLSQILINDATQQQKRFASTVFECGVCFTGRLGSDCVKLPECSHIFCRACLTEFCKVQITEGNVRGVTCPQGDCSSAPTPAQVQALVGEGLFARYDRLLLQSTLERMSDVVYCPRRDCASAVIREKSSNAAMCSVCGFAFCVACRKTYHGADDCQDEKTARSDAEEETEQGKLKLPNSKEGLVALWDDYVSGGKERKRLLESRYGSSALSLRLEGFLSEGWVEVNTKLCPYCFSRIEKNGGCNVMTCFRCCRVFCWACLTKMTPWITNHYEDGNCNRYW